jgi:hypothetical protein
VAVQRGLNDAALHAAAAAVHDPHFPPPRVRRCVDIVADDGRDVSRRERVQIELVLDGNSHDIVVARRHFRFQIQNSEVIRD